MNQLLKGDCLDLMKTLADNSIDAIVTDPPYGLEFMGKEWDKGVPAIEFWIEMLRILKPGGHLLSFSGTRTYHRMAVNIEDAGFEIRDMIEWLYGSGFPKSLNIGKAVDKLQGNEREVVGDNIRLGDKKAYDKNPQNPFFHTDNISTMGKITKGTSEWEGWGTALKPAHEPICMARKPLEKVLTVAENCLKWGTGGINIDESRVEFGDETDSRIGTDALAGGSKESMYGAYSDVKDKNIQMYKGNGRFPANLIHDNSEEVRECFPESKAGGAIKEHKRDTSNINFADHHQEWEGFNDSGNASRFFKSIIYQAKASKSERGLSNNHPTVKPTALMEYLINMVSKENAIVLDPFGGSCTTAIACLNTKRKYICMEKDDAYYEIGLKRVSDWLKKNETNIFK
jgi:site-specific DNA-methyltransferase (adenine-specific)